MCDYNRPQKHVIEVPHFAGDYTVERGSDWKLTLEPSVPRRPGATSASDTLTFRIVSEDREAWFTLSVDSPELCMLIAYLPLIVKGMRHERLFLQCQDMGLQPVENEELQKLLTTAWHVAHDELGEEEN